MRVLLIDDDTELTPMLRFAGESLGVETFHITSSLDALRFLQHQHMDAVIVDLQMPERSGFWLGEEIRRDERDYNKPRAKIAIYTGFSKNDPRVELVAGKIDVPKHDIYQKADDTIFDVLSKLKEESCES